MSKLGLIDMFEQARLDEGVNLLVVVDQFEELFRYRQLEAAGREGDQRISEEARRFREPAAGGQASVTCPIFVVLTMRSDFLGDCTQFSGLAEAINAGQYLVPRMTRDERRAAIEGPVSVGGAEITPVLLTTAGQRRRRQPGPIVDPATRAEPHLGALAGRGSRQGAVGPAGITRPSARWPMPWISTPSRPMRNSAARRRSRSARNSSRRSPTRRQTRAACGVRPTCATLCALADATEAEVTEVIDVFRDPSRSFLMPPAGEALGRRDGDRHLA